MSSEGNTSANDASKQPRLKRLRRNDQTAQATTAGQTGSSMRITRGAGHRASMVSNSITTQAKLQTSGLFLGPEVVELVKREAWKNMDSSDSLENEYREKNGTVVVALEQMASLNYSFVTEDSHNSVIVARNVRHGEDWTSTIEFVKYDSAYSLENEVGMHHPNIFL